MSIYKKFIESAAVEPTPSSNQFTNLAPHQLQPFTAIKQVDYQQQYQPAMLQRQKSRAHMALSPLASVVGATINSSPKSHQYKKLVETHEYPYNKTDDLYGNHQYHKQQNRTNENHYVQHPTQMTTSCQNIKHNHQQRNGQWAPPPSVAPLAAQNYQLNYQANQRCLSMANIQRQHGNGQYAAVGQVVAQNTYSEMHQNHQHPNQHHRHQRAKSAISSSRASSLSLSPQQQQQRHQHQQQQRASANLFRTEDPVLLKWMQAMRFETELECLTALQARTLAIDEHSAAALGVRNSQLAIKEMRLESDMILMLIDCLIDSLPVNFNTIEKFALEFSELYVKLIEQTKPRATTTSQGAHQPNSQNHHTYCNQLNHSLTIINCTPRKSQVSSRTLKPLDKLSIQIREVCIEMANTIQAYQVNYNSYEHIDNGSFEAMLRKIKELLGKFVEISIRAECANIVRALDHDLFGQQRLLSGGSSSSSLRPVRPFESSTVHLPQKWALIALWQLTQDDGYICRVLTEKWQTGGACESEAADGETPHAHQMASVAIGSGQKLRAARRLDYSTKYDNQDENNNNENCQLQVEIKPLGTQADHSLRNDYEKLKQICLNNEQFREKQQQLMMRQQQQQQQQQPIQRQQGALSSALKSKQQPVRQQLSTIELLIDIIISQPNKHERVDMINFLQENKLVDVDELDQSVSAAFHTSNQYKVAALRILIQLCINDQAIKTILKCFSTPPPKHGQPAPENKIIKSIFECYQTGQEHIYQNETVIHPQRTPKKSRKRVRRHDLGAAIVESEQEYSDYGSRQTATNSAPTSSEFGGGALETDEGPIADGDDDDNDEGEDSVVMQAILLLKQITQPFLRGTHGQDYYTLIGRFSIESLVRHLTNIIHTTTSREMLLHSLEALANISFITTEPLKHFGTIAIILEMFRNSKLRSKDVELRDQTVTILANACDKNLLEIVSNGGLAFLLSCLEICPTRMSSYKLRHDMDGSRLNPQTSSVYSSSRRTRGQLDNRPRDRKPIDLSDDFLADLDCACDNQQSLLSSGQSTCLSRLTVKEMAALERIHQKTAVGFSRIASDHSTTWMVLKYGGVKQMIDLCKLSHKRNHSDIVLVALLVALKKISKVIGCDTFRHYNALDLIELEPNRALEIYGRLYASEV